MPLSDIRAGGKAAIARALTALEEEAQSDSLLALLDEAWGAGSGHVLGITGPPGAGKSTLIDALLKAWRGRGETVAVLAVDPSSQTSRGALLGDRVRMRADPEDAGIFIRSLAARGRLGGLSEIAYPASILMRALYDHVIVESVGVGQSEADIAGVADTVALCIQPGSGDSLQFMKAGIIEIPDIAIVTKADMGPVASRALADLKGALQLGEAADDWKVPCLSASASSGQGMDELLAAIDAHRVWLGSLGRLEMRRERQAEAWLLSEISSRFGAEGLAAAAPLASGRQGAPFRLASEIVKRIKIIVSA